MINRNKEEKKFSLIQVKSNTLSCIKVYSNHQKCLSQFYLYCCPQSDKENNPTFIKITKLISIKVLIYLKYSIKQNIYFPFLKESYIIKA